MYQFTPASTSTGVYISINFRKDLRPQSSCIYICINFHKDLRPPAPVSLSVLISTRMYTPSPSVSISASISTNSYAPPPPPLPPGLCVNFNLHKDLRLKSPCVHICIHFRKDLRPPPHPPASVSILICTRIYVSSPPVSILCDPFPQKGS